MAQGDFEMTMSDAGGLFNLSGTGNGLTIIYGVRIFDIDQELLTHVETSEGPSDTERDPASYTPKHLVDRT